MKNIPIKLLDHYKSEVNTIAILVKIKLKDGSELGYTDIDENITFDGLLYKKSSGISPSALSSQAAMSVDNLTFEGLLEDENFTVDDLRAGKLDGSTFYIYRCNYKNIEDGVEIMKTGFLGDVEVDNNSFKFEVRGLGQVIQANTGRTYKPACDAILYDNRCKVLKSLFTVNGTITEDSNNGLISVDVNRTEEKDWFRYGQFTWTSGANKGYSCEVKSFNEGRFEFQLPFFKTIKAGDTYTVAAGCDKTKETCKAKFNNIVNHRGFPGIPKESVVLGQEQ